MTFRCRECNARGITRHRLLICIILAALLAGAILLGVVLEQPMRWAATFRPDRPPNPPNSRPELVLQIAHHHGAQSVAFSQDGRWLVTLSPEARGEAKIWITETGELLRTFVGDQGFAAGAVSPDRAVLATGGDAHNPTVKLWDTRNGRLLRTLAGHRPHVGGGVLLVAFSPDGRMLFSASNREVVIWNWRTARRETTLRPEKRPTDYPISSAAVSEDGRTVATQSQGHMQLWDVTTGRVRRRLQKPNTGWSATALSPDGQRLAVENGGEVLLWGEAESPLIVEPHTTRVRRSFSLVQPSGIRAVDFSHPGRLAVAAGNAVEVWDVNAGRLSGPSARMLWQDDVAPLVRMQDIDVFYPFPMTTSVSLSADGTRVASASENGEVQLRDARTGRLIRTLRPYHGGAGWLSFSPRGDWLASLSSGEARIWDVRAGRLRRTLEKASCVALSRTGTLAATWGQDGQVRVRDLRQEGPPQLLPGSMSRASSLKFSPDGGTVVGAWLVDRGMRGPAGYLGHWDLRTARARQVPVDGWEFPAAFSPDGRRIAARSYPGVRVLDAWSGRLLRTTGELRGPLAFSPDGRLLAACTRSRDVELLDVRTGQRVRMLRGHHLDVAAIGFSSDGRTAVTGDASGTLRVWDLATAQPRAPVVRSVPGDGARPESLAFSPDGRTVAVGDEGGVLRLLDAQTGGLRATLQILPSDTETEPSIDWIAFTPEGYYDASPGAARFIRWRVGHDLFPAGAYERAFHRPELVRKALGRKQ